MKKQIINSNRTGFFHKSILILSFVMGCGYASKATNRDTTAPKASVVYEGRNNNLLVFNVNYKNPDSSAFDLLLTDENGEVLLSKRYTGPNFERKIFVDKGPQDCELKFVIRDGKTAFDKSFSLKTERKTIQDVVITKL